MAKYHINPETGRPNICNPEKTSICKYTVDGKQPEHYQSKDDAKNAYEKIGKKEFGATSTLQKKSGIVFKTKKYQSQMLTQEETNSLMDEMYKEFSRIESKARKKYLNTLVQYTIGLSTEVNRFLHNIPMKRHSTNEDIDYIKKSISELDIVINKFEKREKVRKLYRFVIVPEGKTQEEFAEELVTKKEYSDTGFMSTTEDLAYIVGSAYKYKQKVVIFEIETDRGISLCRDKRESVGSIQSFEKERLLPRDMSFDIEDYGVTSLTVDEDRNTTRHQFAGYYTEDWQTGKTIGRNIPKRKFPIIKLVDKNLNNEENNG